MRVVLASAASLALCLANSATLAQAQPQETSQPATPAPQASATTISAAASSDSGNQVVCQSATQRGSLIPSRTCHTQREWDAMRVQGQRSVNDAQMRGLTSRPMGK